MGVGGRDIRGHHTAGQASLCLRAHQGLRKNWILLFHTDGNSIKPVSPRGVSEERGGPAIQTWAGCKSDGHRHAGQWPRRPLWFHRARGAVKTTWHPTPHPSIYTRRPRWLGLSIVWPLISLSEAQAELPGLPDNVPTTSTAFQLSNMFVMSHQRRKTGGVGGPQEKPEKTKSPSDLLSIDWQALKL